MKSDEEDVVGTVSRVQLSQQRGDKKYFDIFIPSRVATSLKLSHKDLVKIKARNQAGEETSFTRKVYKSGSQFKLSLPTDVAKELGVDEKDLLDLFIVKD